MHERHRKERLRLYLEQLQQDNILHHVSFLIKSRSKHASLADNQGMQECGSHRTRPLPWSGGQLRAEHLPWADLAGCNPGFCRCCI